MKKDIQLSSIRVFGIGLGLVLQLILVKLIGSKQYGVYVLFLTWSNIISQILILGYDRFLIKEISYLYLQREKGKFKYTLNKLLFFVFINCIIFLVLAFLIPINALRGTIFSHDIQRSTWILIALGSILFTGSALMGKIFISTERVELSYLRSEVVYKFILVASVFIFYFFLKAWLGMNIILAGAVLSYALTILIFLFIDRKRLKQYLNIKKEKVELSRENYTFFFLTVNYFLIGQIDRIQLGRVAGMEVLGIYGLATTLVNMINFSIVGYQRFIPKISTYLNNNQIEELETEFKVVVKNAIILALPAMMFLFVYAEDVLRFFGPKYVVVANALRVLLFGQMISYFTGPNGNLLINGKHAKVDLINSAVVLLLTIVLNVVGYKMYGFIGVAVATSFGLTLINLVKVVEVKYFYNIIPYEMDNILLTVIVLLAFIAVKFVDFTSNSLILFLAEKFVTGMILAVITATITFRLRGQRLFYTNKK